MSARLPATRPQAGELTVARNEDFVTATIADQLFGIPVLQVQDVLGPQRITRIPLSPPEVAGSLNLRGRIVTAIDVRLRLGLPKAPAGSRGMSIVVDHRGELYSLMVDNVGDVLSLEGEPEEAPATVPAGFRRYARGVHRRPGELLVELDFARLMDEVTDAHAEAK